MIVLAESNFVLELGFQQEEAGDAERIVLLAETRRIELGIPACALIEPYGTLVDRQRQREQLVDESLRQIGRSLGRGDVIARADVLHAFSEAVVAEKQALHESVQRLMACCRVQILTDSIIRTAQEFESRFGLGPHDAVVLASIEVALREAGAGEKLFITGNSEHFDNPRVTDLLGSYSCKLITNFADARRFVENRVAAECAV